MGFIVASLALKLDLHKGTTALVITSAIMYIIIKTDNFIALMVIIRGIIMELLFKIIGELAFVTFVAFLAFVVVED